MTLRVTLHVRPDAPSIPPPALVRSVINFPYGAAFNGALFPACPPATINRHGERSCPRGSLIGSGHAIGVGDTVRQRLRVRLYNGPGGRSVVFYLHSTNPLRVNTAFAAPLRRFHTGRWNFELTVVVPESLRVVAGVELALEEFVSTVQATRRIHGRKRGYIEAWACPPGAQVPVQGRFAFLEGPGALVKSWATCG